MQKGQVLIFLLVGILVIAIAGGAYYLGRQTTPKSAPAPVVTSSTLQPTPSPSPISDEMSTWKTYTNQLYQFSFKYPPSWTVSDKNVYLLSDGSKSEDKDPTRPWLLKEVSVYHPEKEQNLGGPWMHIEVTNESLDQAIRRVENDLNSGTNKLFVKSRSTQTINNNDWSKLTWDNEQSPGNGGEFYLINRNTKTYSFSCNYLAKAERICQQILSAFKFL